MYIVGIGGTVRPNSSSDRALRVALDRAESAGAKTRHFTGSHLRTLPMYDPMDPVRTDAAREFVAELRAADGIIITSAAYHGSISGMLKNALDYTEDMAQDDNVYLAGKPVGMIAVGKGWQAGANTLVALRSIVHALRGWPTPYGCVLNTAATADRSDPVTAGAGNLGIVATEVVWAAQRFGHSLIA
ncbi:NAD(P)H-dependent oxidoreductase [Nocardia sp. NPDC050799]|uniref:NADPH-dependent FMN reductase n=1 Tax=Nocardia sp. NPDC050799 TaxID=3154842 RepID=UPI0033F8F963